MRFVRRPRTSLGAAWALGCALAACTDDAVGPAPDAVAADVVIDAASADADVLAEVSADACQGPECGGKCAAGQIRAGDQCVPVDSLVHWCGDYCDTVAMACHPDATQPAACAEYCAGSLAPGPGCVPACLGALDEPGAVQRTVCGGLMRRMDSVDCRDLVHCAEPVEAPACATLCTAAQNCAMLADSGLLLGGSTEECQLYCEAMASALTPSQRFAPLHQCLTVATQKCDPLHMLACTVVGVAELEGSLCTQAAADCGLIPEVFPNVAACDAQLQAWTAGQRIFVAGCLNIGGNYALCGEHQCASPPASLPTGALAAAQTIMAHCPHLLVSPAQYEFAAQYYAWLFTAVLQSAGQPIDRDYSLISACFLSSPCPATKEGTMHCLLTTPKD